MIFPDYLGLYNESLKAKNLSEREDLPLLALKTEEGSHEPRGVVSLEASVNNLQLTISKNLGNLVL